MFGVPFDWTRYSAENTSLVVQKTQTFYKKQLLCENDILGKIDRNIINYELEALGERQRYNKAPQKLLVCNGDSCVRCLSE